MFSFIYLFPICLLICVHICVQICLCGGVHIHPDCLSSATIYLSLARTSKGRLAGWLALWTVGSRNLPFSVFPILLGLETCTIKGQLFFFFLRDSRLKLRSWSYKRSTLRLPNPIIYRTNKITVRQLWWLGLVMNLQNRESHERWLLSRPGVWVEEY